MATLTNVNDKIISQKALEGLTAYLSPFSAFSTNYDDDAKQKGDTVVVPLVGTLTATTFSNYEVGGGTMTAATVLLNQHKNVPLDLTDIQFANSSSAQLEKWGFQAGQALGELVTTTIWAAITSVNFTIGYTYPVASWNVARLLEVRRVQNVGKVPQNDRSLFLDPTSMAAILGDVAVQSASLYGGNSAIREGRIDRVGGYNLFESSLIPTTNTQYGFAVHPSAIAVAVRGLQPSDSSMYLASGLIREAVSGLTIGYRRHYSPSAGRQYLNFECVFGSAAGITGSLHRIAFQ